MPKGFCSKQTNTFQSRYRGSIRAAMETHGIRSVRQLSEKTKIPYRTLVERMKDDDGTNSFRIEEVLILQKHLGVFPEL